MLSFLNWNTNVRDRRENEGTDKDFFLVGVMQNGYTPKSVTFTLVYFVLSFILWIQTWGGSMGHDGLVVQRTFRSVHVMPKSLTDNAPGYWTFDWLTHPFRSIDGLTGEASVESAKVNPALCLHEFDECADGWTKASGLSVKGVCKKDGTSLHQKEGKFSCAITRNQTRFGPGLYNSHCASLSSKYEQVACQMQRTADVDIVVNDDKSFSMSSGHSRIVLMFYVCVIMFTVNLFTIFDSPFLTGTMAYFGDWDNEKEIVKKKQFTAILIFLLLIMHRFFYGTKAQELGIETPMPNGTFFYGLLAYVAVTWFLSYHETNKEESVDVPSAVVVKNDMELKPLNGSADLNLEGFQTKKIRTNAFMQPGSGYQGKVRPTDEDSSDLTFSQNGKTVVIQARNYNVRPSTSVWAMTNLWVWPLIILSAFITKSNYQLDIELTVVLVGFFFTGLIELFTKRLLELKYIYKNIQKTAKDDNVKAEDFSIDYGVTLVVLVSIVVQMTTLAIVFWTANWSGLAWTPNYEQSGVFTIGDPEKSNRASYIWWVKTFYLVYYTVVQIYKFFATVSLPEGYYHTLKNEFYMNMDGWMFFLLNVCVLCVTIPATSEAGYKTDAALGWYDAGVFLQAVAKLV